MSEHCAVAACPGPGAVPVGEQADELAICRLHADSGVVVVERDERGRAHLHVDMARIRFSLSSRRGRLFRQILEAIGAT